MRYIFNLFICEEIELFSGCEMWDRFVWEDGVTPHQSPTLDILFLGWTAALLCSSDKTELEFILFRHQLKITGCKSVNYSINYRIYFSK